MIALRQQTLQSSEVAAGRVRVAARPGPGFECARIPAGTPKFFADVTNSEFIPEQPR